MAVRRLCRQHNIDILSILETKFKYNKRLAVKKKFGSHWQWICNFNHSHRGRIWVGWNNNYASSTNIAMHEQIIHAWCFYFYDTTFYVDLFHLLTTY